MSGEIIIIGIFSLNWILYKPILKKKSKFWFRTFDRLWSLFLVFPYFISSFNLLKLLNKLTSIISNSLIVYYSILKFNINNIQYVHTYINVYTHAQFQEPHIFGPGIKNFLEIFHLAPIKQILKYLPGNIQDPIKNIYI